MYEVVAIITGPECAPGVFATFFATGMDEIGNVVGTVSCNIVPTAGVWTGGATAVPFANSGESRAFDLTDPDHVVGGKTRVGQEGEVAAYWEFGQLRTFLDTAPGHLRSRAHAINGSQQIVGEWTDAATGALRAFLWQDGASELLSIPLASNSVANDINENGQIVGYMGGAPWLDSNAFLWDNGVLTDLGKIPGGNSADALVINNRSHVAGRGWVPDGVTTFGQPHAFFWDGATMIDIGTLPGDDTSLARDMNAVDQIVGDSSFDGNLARAFLWQDGVMHNLNDLVVTDLGGDRIDAAIAINNDGWIIAATSASERGLLIPVDSRPGDVDKNCIIGIDDFLLVLSEWGQEGSFADTDDDGEVGILDFLNVLANWG